MMKDHLANGIPFSQSHSDASGSFTGHSKSLSAGGDMEGGPLRKVKGKLSSPNSPLLSCPHTAAFQSEPQTVRGG